RAYADGTADPVAVMDEVSARIAAHGDDAVWLARIPPQQLRAEAAALRRRAAEKGTADLPLFGLPFAAKDNIDVAGLPTTAACPAASRLPQRSAPVVERLRRAGALCVGKTNLDQFATGLVGVRSPFGAPRNPFDPAFIPGGSSSGSAVAVAAGLVSFALGTDTAGSGRVPAACNNIVGLKPTRGLIGTSGIVPACRSLDCVSIFALTVADAALALDIARSPDAEDACSRAAPPGFGAFGARPERFAFGVPPPDQREFFGDPDGAALFQAAITRVETLGGHAVDVDLTPFREAGALLYHGPWLAERRQAIDAALGGRRDLLHPVTRRIVDGGKTLSAADAFAGLHRLAELERQTRRVWRQIDLLMVPTTGTIYRIAEIEADPIALNDTLGHYTAFANLLDLCAFAVPSGFRRNGLPFGVSLLAPAFHDPLLAAVAAAFQAAGGLTLGATGALLPPADPSYRPVRYPYLPVAVAGTRSPGRQPTGALLALGARLRRTIRTAPQYRLYASPDGEHLGLVFRPGDGVAIETEVWDVPTAAIAALLAALAPPLGLGTITLADGS
ncbi:MAG TPA: allophanate hydrolase, partial [Stellaceae bacterium]|nr:allophanate hydrolase [Stellaceae bacterium]